MVCVNIYSDILITYFSEIQIDNVNTFIQENASKYRLHNVCYYAWAELIHWGLVTPYGDIDLGQHWLR